MCFSPDAAETKYRVPALAGILECGTMSASTPVSAFNFSSDVLVNIHIPKAGGSYFEENILPHLPSPIPCVSRVQSGRFSSQPDTMRCYRSTNSSSEWLWSRNTGFTWSCGVHAGYSEFLNCFKHVPRVVAQPRRLWFIAVMRHPIERLLSEFAHTRAGNVVWSVGRFRSCASYMVSEAIKYYNHSDHTKKIPWNYKPTHSGEREAADALAMAYMAYATSEQQQHHRQTRMLFAPPVSCPDRIEHIRDVQRLYTEMLESARGVIRHQQVLVGIFEHMQRTLRYFGHQMGVELEHLASSYKPPLPNDLQPLLRLRLTELEYLDMNLYRFANATLFHRTDAYKSV